MPSRRNWKRSRSVPPASACISRSSTRISICRLCCRDSLGRDDGWRRAWVPPEGNQGARRRLPLLEETASWAAAPERCGSRQTLRTAAISATVTKLPQTRRGRRELMPSGISQRPLRLCGKQHFRNGNTKKRLIGGGIGRGYARFRGDAVAAVAIFHAGADERGEKRMRRKRLRFEFRMELAAQKPRMIGSFHDFDVHAVRRAPRDAKSGARERLLILAIEFVAMAMTFGNFELAVGLVRERARLESCTATRPAASCRPFRPRRAVRAICRSRDWESMDRIRCCRRGRCAKPAGRIRSWRTACPDKSRRTEFFSRAHT